MSGKAVREGWVQSTSRHRLVAFFCFIRRCMEEIMGSPVQHGWWTIQKISDEEPSQKQSCSFPNPQDSFAGLKLAFI